jgi:AraC-like DNA-binding protein
VVRTAFARAPEPLALDALVLQLAEGLLRFSAAGSTGTLRCRVDLAAVERGRDYLRSRLTIVQSSEVAAVTGLDRYQFARQFRAVYGTSPYRYSVMRRLDVARGRLATRGPWQKRRSRLASPTRHTSPGRSSGIRHDARPVREALRGPCRCMTTLRSAVTGCLMYGSCSSL